MKLVGHKVHIGKRKHLRSEPFNPLKLLKPFLAVGEDTDRVEGIRFRLCLKILPPPRFPEGAGSPRDAPLTLREKKSAQSFNLRNQRFRQA